MFNIFKKINEWLEKKECKKLQFIQKLIFFNFATEDDDYDSYLCQLPDTYESFTMRTTCSDENLILDLNIGEKNLVITLDEETETLTFIQNLIKALSYNDFQCFYFAEASNNPNYVMMISKHCHSIQNESGKTINFIEAQITVYNNINSNPEWINFRIPSLDYFRDMLNEAITSNLTIVEEPWYKRLFNKSA